MSDMKLAKGPQTVLQALVSGDPAALEEALQFQRESFKAALGCFPEELVHERCDKPLRRCRCEWED